MVTEEEFIKEYNEWLSKNTETIVLSPKVKVGTITLNPEVIVTFGSSCDHEWKEYVGLAQTFNYCTKCDVKQ